MIFILSQDFIQKTNPNELSDLVAEIVSHEHFLKIPGGNVSDRFHQIIRENASVTQFELMNLYQGFNIPNQVKQYLTCVSDAQYSYRQLFLMASKPALILMENLREWRVYKRIISVFCGDSSFGFLFKMLKSAADDESASRLRPVQAGGSGEMSQLINHHKNTDYKGVAEKKIFVVFDSDLESRERNYQEKNKNLFLTLCGKDHKNISESDIYTLSQPTFIWHMWYRRELENYFPDSVFESFGFPRNPGKPPFENNHYAKFSDYFCNKEKRKDDIKNSLGEFAESMDRAMFEKNQKVFPLNGMQIGEITLFLLKMVKVL